MILNGDPKRYLKAVNERRKLKWIWWNRCVF
nr:hypothetical protein [Pseudoflavonifractor phocaeensis]